MPKNFTMPTEAKLWYYEDFLTTVEDSHLLTDRAEDWKRLCVLDGEKLRPAMPNGFSGRPSDEQIEDLYARMKAGKLYLFALGNELPTQIHYYDSELEVDPELKKPLAPQKPNFEPIPKPDVPDPNEQSENEGLTEEERKANAEKWSAYRDAVSKQDKEKHDYYLRLGIEEFNKGRNLEQESREMNARRKNKPLQQIRRNRDKAEYVTSKVMAPRPTALPEVFFARHRNVPAEERGVQRSAATFDYGFFEKYMEPNGYDLNTKNEIDDYDAATINLAMIGATTEMEDVARNKIPDIGGPVAIKNQALDGMYFILSGMFGEVRKDQSADVFMAAALNLGNYFIHRYLEGNAAPLGKNLAESVRNLKSCFSAAVQEDLTSDLVAGTNLAERLLKLFDKKPDILAATGLQEDEIEFLRGYVQMGKVYDNYTHAHMKLNEADALGKQLSTQEKASLLADVVIRRMVERELSEDKSRVEASPEYEQLLNDVMQKDEALESEYERWKARHDFGNQTDAQIREEYKKTHDLTKHVAAITRYPAEHKVISLLAKPGMLERLRQSLRNDPAILEIAQKAELEIKDAELFQSPRLDALAQQLKPALQNSAYAENDKHNWFVSMKSLLVKGKVNRDPDAISPWLNAKIAGDANRLMVVQTDDNGNKTMRPATELLENGLQSLQDPDQKTINQLHNWASEGDLYYYDVGKDMPLRLNADGQKAGVENLVVPPKPGFWKTLAYYLTFRHAFAEEIEFSAKDRDPAAVNLFLNAKEERAAVAANEDTMRRQAAPKVKKAVDPSKAFNRSKAEDKDYSSAVGKAIDDMMSFKQPMDGVLGSQYPQYTKGQLEYKLYTKMNALTDKHNKFIIDETSDIAQKTRLAFDDKNVTKDQIVRLMARSVLLEAVKKAQALKQNGNIEPIEQKMLDNPKEMVDALMNNATFKRFTHNASVDMLKHFVMVDGAVNMQEALPKFDMAKNKQPAPENAHEQVKQKQNVGIGL